MMRDHELREPERAEQVDVEDAPPVVEVGLLDERRPGCSGRRCAPARRCGRTRARAASTRRWQSSGLVMSVGTASARRPRARTAGGHLLEHRGGARGEHDVGAFARAGERDLARRCRGRCRRRWRRGRSSSIASPRWARCGITSRPKASIWSTARRTSACGSGRRSGRRPSACSSRSDAAMRLARARARVRPEVERRACRRRATRCWRRSRSARRRAPAGGARGSSAICAGQLVAERALRQPAVAARGGAPQRRRACCRRPRSAAAAAAPAAGGARRRAPCQTRPVVLRVLVAERRRDDVDAPRRAACRAARSRRRASANSPSRWPAPTPRMTRPPESASSVANAFAVCERMAVGRDPDVRQQPHRARWRRRASRASRRRRTSGRHGRGVRARDADVVAHGDVEEAGAVARLGDAQQLRRARRRPPTARRRPCSAPRPAAACPTASRPGGTIWTASITGRRPLRRAALAHADVVRCTGSWSKRGMTCAPEQLDRCAARPPAAASRRGRRR